MIKFGVKESAAGVHCAVKNRSGHREKTCSALSLPTAFSFPLPLPQSSSNGLSSHTQKSFICSDAMVNPQSIIQSEVSQKETNNCCILAHIYGIEENDTDEPICGTGMETKA